METARIPDPDPITQRPCSSSHRVLQTARFEPMVDGYKSALRAKPMFENSVVAFLTYDEEHHRIMIGHNPNATPRDPKASGVVHWAYSFEKLACLVDAYERLKAVGLVPHNGINHGFTSSFYSPDPDGNEVELAVDDFASNEAMNAWFATGAFDRNFIGTPVDPADVARRHRAGAADADIFEATYA